MEKSKGYLSDFKIKNLSMVRYDSLMVKERSWCCLSLSTLPYSLLRNLEEGKYFQQGPMVKPTSRRTHTDVNNDRKTRQVHIQDKQDTQTPSKVHR